MTINRGTALRAALALALLAPLVVGALAASATARSSAGALPSAEILFQRGDDLWIARADGSNARLLTQRAGQAAVSPDA